MSQNKRVYPEFSGAIQQKSTPYIKKVNEVRNAKNADFSTIIGAIRRRQGAQSTVASLPTLPVVTSPLGAYIARFPSTNELWAVQNNAASSPASSILQYWTGSAWSNIATSLQPSVEANITDDLDEVWCSFYDPATDTIYDPFTVDSTHDVSAIRQLQFAPKGRFYMEFNGAMWAFDCLVGSNRYRNRAYKSSGPTGAISFARSAQTDVGITFDIANQVPRMFSNTTPAGVAAASSTFVTMSHLAWNAFDGSKLSNNTWISHVGNPTGWVSYDFGVGNSKIITHYSLTGVASDDSTIAGANRAPKNFDFQGSNDNSTWTTIDSQTNQTIWAPGETRLFSTTNSTSYRYYRVNVTANNGDTDLVIIVELQFLNSTTNISLLQLEVDSVRYLKPGMAIDVYTAGTDTKIYDILISGVDKANDIINFLPFSQNFGTSAVNTTTDVITVADTSQFVTGTPIKFVTSGTLPAGLVVNTTYYAINLTSTTIQVAATKADATLGSPIDITTTGTGSFTINLSYVIGNKDELWAHGRKGKLTRFWNTDYRNPEVADWIKLPPTLDAAAQINAVGKIANRLFMWTKHSMIRFDGQNILPLRNDIGCIAQKSVCYYDSFMIWLDAHGNIWVRNEHSGSMDIISLAIQETMDTIPESQLASATAVCVNGVYKLYLGQVNGKTVRVVYSFLTNQWSVESFTPKMPIQLEYAYNNQIHPHFFDEKGQFWVDEEGLDDNGTIISFLGELGDDNFGVDEIKEFYGIKVYARAVAATKVMVSIDMGQFMELGQLTKGIQSIPFKQNTNGTTINVRFIDSSSKKPVQIDRATVYWNPAEDTFRATK